MSFFEELKRRNVVRVGVVYLIASWLLAQVADLLLENFQAPDWVIQAVLIVLLVGFPLALIFAWAFELTPEGIKKEKDVDRSQSITSVTGRKLDRAIIVVLVVALSYFIYESRFSATDEGEAALAESETSAAPAKSIAVLPFVNMSSDTEQEYFSDGISEEILNSLAKIKELKVAGRTSSFAFKGQNQDLRQIGDTLGVEHILEGSVRKAGAKVRITAQLIQVDDGFHLWSETYDRELNDVFAIQDEIATAILVQLKAHLLEGEQIVIASPVAHSEAYDLYLLAKQRIYERTRPSLESAAELLDKAIAIDPEYAPAFAQRGITAMLLCDRQYGILPHEQSQTQAKLYLDQALRLDPQQPEGLAGMGLYYTNEPGRTDEAIQSLEQALAINPALINASNWLQVAYSDAVKLAESMQILEKMYERDPLYRPGIANLNNVYVERMELDKARAMIEHVRPFMPNDPFLLRMESNIELAQGNAAQGLILIERALEMRPDNGPNNVRRGLALVMTAQHQRLAEEGVPWQKIFALHILGRTEEANILAWERANSGENVSDLIYLLANSGKPEQMVRFFEERWNSLDEFESQFPLLGRVGVDTMLDIAYAYGATGNVDRFDDAMKRSRDALDTLAGLGYKGSWLTFNNALYFILAGERGKALVLLSDAVDTGLLLGVRFSRALSAMQVMDGDPEYEAIQARMFDHLNAERAKLGLEAVST
jgi:TolB-like protein/Tfp pilus assembly protein PilF